MNHLCVSTCEAIKALALRGWSRRRIARELDLNRETVGRHLGPAKPAIPPPGPAPTPDSEPAIPPSGSAEEGAEPKPAIPAPGSVAGRRSQCEELRAVIVVAVEQGLSAQRIYQDLVTGHAFRGSYTAVKRFVRPLRAVADLPFRRWESAPGEEAQIDFGQGAWVVDEQGRRRRPHLLRVVLSHSRKGYSEALWHQTTEEFIRGLQNAFLAFGGVPARLVVDNLRAAVKRVDWFEPELNPRVREFCAHYGTVMLPTRPAKPRHKGKVKSAVIRVLQGFLGLADAHPIGAIERAARRAIDQGAWRLRELKALLAEPEPQLTLGFLESHPLIRDLDHYAHLTPDCFDTP